MREQHNQSQLFRENLRALRLAKGINAQWLSTHLGLRHKNRITEIESGRAIYSRLEFQAICKELKVCEHDMSTKQIDITITFKNY